MLSIVGESISAVYLALGRPDESLLPHPVVKREFDKVFDEMVQDESLKGRARRTVVADVTLSPDEVDYVVDVPGVTDFEAVRLERGYFASQTEQRWTEVFLVPFEAWERHYDRDYLAASVYGGHDGRVRVKLNFDRSEFDASLWRLSYQQPLLTTAAEGEQAPIPSAFVGLAEDKVLLRCVNILLRDVTLQKDYREALRATLPDLRDQIADGDARYREHLERTREPTTVPMPRYDDFRRGYVRRHRAYLPIGDS
jgi:hypothetical protein